MATSIGLLIVGIVLGVLAGGLVGSRMLVSRRAAAAEAERGFGHRQPLVAP